MRLLIIAIAFATVVFSCKTRQKDATQPKKMEKKIQYDFSILFGSGGGFTGMYDDYVLKPNGKLYKLDEENPDQLLKTIEEEELELIFSKTKKLSLETLEVNEPGNITNYLGIKGQGKEHKIVWGNPGVPIPDNVMEVYTKLNELLR